MASRLLSSGMAGAPWAVLVLLGCMAYAQDAEIEFVAIPAGEFQMGCSAADSPYLPDGSYGPCTANAQPAHSVRITRSFEIGKFEVTQAQWQAVMGANPSHFRGLNLPVEQILWDDVQEFLARLNARHDGYRYRLPTEAEWEYSARAGSTKVFGDRRLEDQAWFGESGGLPLPESQGRTHPVGQKAPNAWGLYDMLGNVQEWVQDWYREGYLDAGAVADPQGPATGQYHVARGGSWFSISSYLRLWNRYITVPVLKRRDTGIRLVRQPDR